MASMLKLEPQFALTGRYDYLWRCLSQKCAHCNKVTRFLKFETVKYIIYISYSWLLKLAAHGDYIENVTNQLREDRFPACDYISNANCAQGSGLRGPTTLELSIERAVEIVLGTYSNRYCLNRQNRVRWTIRWERWPGAIWPSSWVVHPHQGLKLVSSNLLGNFLQSTYCNIYPSLRAHINFCVDGSSGVPLVALFADPEESENPRHICHIKFRGLDRHRDATGREWPIETRTIKR